MSHRIITRSLPVTAALIAGLAAFLLFGGRETLERSGSYACPMLCVVLDAPGVCPVCGMDLEQLVETGDTLIVSDVGSALAELSSVEVTERFLTTISRFPARVVFNGEAVVEATSWIEGRISDVRITGPGESVERGQILAVLHSPQALSARTDYLSAVTTADPFLMEAASGRLQELGIQPSTVSEPSGAAYIRAPVSGRIGEIFVNSGAWLSRGSSFATVLEDNEIELRIDVTESLSFRMEIGLPVLFSYAGERWNTTVERVSAEIDFESRSLPVYADLPDELLIAVGSYLMVEVRFVELPDPVTALPEKTVLILGERSIVYIDLGEGRYVPRVVRTGDLAFDENSEPFYPVLEGVVVGERVVLDGAFLLDSQAELTGITSLMNNSVGDGL